VISSDDSTDPVWNLVDVVVDSAAAEVVSDFLWSHGVAAVEERNAGEATVLRTSTAIAATILRGLPGVLRIEEVAVPRSVADTWRRHARPSPVARGLAIVPAWCREEWPPEDSVLVEPGDAFGAGNHPSTLLAARLLVRHASGGDTVYDMGCGTGVLAILAARHLGCRARVWDVAPGCISVVEENVRLNGLDPGDVCWVPPSEAGMHAVVVANILAPILREESNVLIGLCRPGGAIILSGMRSDQVTSVTEAFGLPVVDAMEENGWEAIVLRRRESGAA
jgi:ribosomal protein L11 methyltransferase